MSQKIWFVSAACTAVLSLILLVCIFVFPPCSGFIETAAGGHVPMKCHWAFRGVIPIALQLTFTAVGQFFLKEAKVRRLSSIFIMALSVVAILITTNTVIGICMKTEMPCNTTALFSRLFLGLLILVALIQLFWADKTQKRKRKF